MQRASHWLLPTLALGLTVTTGCAKKKSTTDTSTSTGATVSSGGGTTSSGSSSGSNVPQVSAISLVNLGASSSGLALDDSQPTCNQGKTDGVMGLALGAACATAPLAANIIQGHQSIDFNGDGKIDCNDFTAAKAQGVDPGLLLNLMCQPVVLNNDNLVSVAVGTTSAAFAVSFAAWPGDTNSAVGAWSAASSASFPADIRVWSGTTSSLAAMTGLAAIALTDINDGAIQVPDLTMGTKTTPVPISLKFSGKTSTTGCTATNISDGACNWQETYAYTADDTAAVLPMNGLHLKVWADSKTAPTTIAVEGKYTYDAATAEAQWGSNTTCPNLHEVATIYFQVVQAGGQDWGMFQFLDANGHQLTCGNSGPVDYMTNLAQPSGICQNVGASTAVTCTAVNYQNFTSLWAGESAFTAVTASPVSSTLFTTGEPTASGVCLEGTGCRAFQASDIK